MIFLLKVAPKNKMLEQKNGWDSYIENLFPEYINKV